MLQNDIKSTLGQLTNLLNQLDNAKYTRSNAQLGIASIGEHTRHIIEMFNCLLINYRSGIVNYDARERNKLIENAVDEAVIEIESIKNNLDKPNKSLVLIQADKSVIQTNYERELLYNLEHCIHHQALIKISLFDATDLILSSHFGVAPSTIAYRKKVKLEYN